MLLYKLFSFFNYSLYEFKDGLELVETLLVKIWKIFLNLICVKNFTR